VNESPPNDDRLLRLAEAVCEKTATPENLAELDALLLADDAACHRYLSYCRMHVGLKMDMLAHKAAQDACQQIDSEVAKSAAAASDLYEAPVSSSLPLNLLTSAFHNTIGFFSQEIPFSLLIATVVTGLGLWLGSLIFVTHHKSVAKDSRPAKPATVETKSQYVGRITSMVDVHWADASTAAVTDLVALGRKYAIASGMMEITYDTGAVVTLQGPVTYEADSRDGGYLTIGKLRARLDKRGEGREERQEKPSVISGNGSEKVASGQWSVASKEGSGFRVLDINQKSEIRNHKSPAPTFAVRTPTATVTDLGTEFTVEVRPDKSSEIYVLRGMVEAVRDSRTGGKPVRERLTAGQGICFLNLNESPQRIAPTPTTRVRLPAAVTNITRRIHNARAAKAIIAPTNVVASAYHAVQAADGRLAAKNDRQLAFEVVTDDLYGRGEKNEGPKSSFNTQILATGHQPLATSFVGLLYGNKKTRFDRIKVFLARQTTEGGSWAEPPKLFILKKPVDTNQTRPEDDPDNWQELPYQPLYGAFNPKASPGPGAVIEIALTGSSTEDRTGYGWALGGVPGNGSQGYVSVTELRAYMSPLLEEESKQEQENKSSGQDP